MDKKMASGGRALLPWAFLDLDLISIALAYSYTNAVLVSVQAFCRGYLMHIYPSLLQLHRRLVGSRGLDNRWWTFHSSPPTSLPLCTLHYEDMSVYCEIGHNTLSVVIHLELPAM